MRALLAILVLLTTLPCDGQVRRRVLGPKPSAGSWTPLQLPNLKMWLTASNISAADGTALDTWADKSANGWDVYQPTAGAKRPLLTNAVASANGQKGVWFKKNIITANNPWMYRPGVQVNRPLTVHVIARGIAATDLDYGGYWIDSTNAAGSVINYLRWRDGSYLITAGQIAGGTASVSVNTSAAYTNFIVSCIFREGPGNTDIYTNGVNGASAALNASSQFLDGITICNNGNQSDETFNGFVFDIAVQSGAATSTDIANWYNYAKSTYGW